MDMIELGQYVRKSRLATKLTQAQLAGSAGLSRSTVANLESGTLREIGVTKLQSLLSALGKNFSLGDYGVTISADERASSLKKQPAFAPPPVLTPAQKRSQRDMFKEYASSFDLTSEAVTTIIEASTLAKPVELSSYLDRVVHAKTNRDANVSETKVSTHPAPTLVELLKARSNERERRYNFAIKR